MTGTEDELPPPTPEELDFVVYWAKDFGPTTYTKITGSGIDGDYLRLWRKGFMVVINLAMTTAVESLEHNQMRLPL
jgi:hypothetical protein